MQFPYSLGAPLIDGFTEAIQGDHQRIQFDAGTRVRRKVRDRASATTAAYLLNREQKEQLQQFHRQAAGDVFTMELPGPDDQMVTYNVKFVGQLAVQPITGELYQCRFALRTVTNPMIPRSELEQAMVMLIISRTDFHKPLHDTIHAPNF